MVMSVVRVLIGLVPVTIMAIIFFGFNLWGLGFAVAAFFGNLILTSWTIGLISCGLVLKNGMGAESLAWSLTFLLLPLTCVYYPVAVLPEWLQWLALSLPPTHVFEGLRALILRREFDEGAMLTAPGAQRALSQRGLRIVRFLLRSARQSGSLMQTGE
jgi:ABC-2 type transport system permease protein